MVLVLVLVRMHQTSWGSDWQGPGVNVAGPGAGGDPGWVADEQAAARLPDLTAFGKLLQQPVDGPPG